MAMNEAQKRYRENNPRHKRADDEKRLDLVISAEAMDALAAKCKAAGVTRRQMLEAMVLSSFQYHAGVMVPTGITPVLPDEPVTPTVTPGLSDPPSAGSDIEAQILKMIEGGFRKGETSPIPKQVVQLYNGDYPEAAKQVRLLASRYKDTPSHESLQTLANRIDGSRPKTKPPTKRSNKNDKT